MANEFNNVQVANINNRIITIGASPNVIANRACVGMGFLAEFGEAHPGTFIEVSYTFADSFGERFGADKLTAPSYDVITSLQEMLKPIMAAKATMNFNEKI